MLFHAALPLLVYHLAQLPLTGPSVTGEQRGRGAAKTSRAQNWGLCVSTAGEQKPGPFRTSSLQKKGHTFSCPSIHLCSKTELTGTSTQPLADAWHNLVLQMKLREAQLCTGIVEPTSQS